MAVVVVSGCRRKMTAATVIGRDDEQFRRQVRDPRSQSPLVELEQG